MANKKTPEKEVEICVLIDAEDQFKGYFKGLESVQRYMEREAIEEATIIIVKNVISASYPPEPELELLDVEFKDLEFTK